MTAAPSQETPCVGLHPKFFLTAASWQGNQSTLQKIELAMITQVRDSITPALKLLARRVAALPRQITVTRPTYVRIASLGDTRQQPSAFAGPGVKYARIRPTDGSDQKPIQFYSCFISYSHEDKTFARLLHDRLQGQGIRCCRDEQLLPGDDLHDGIDRAIRLWDKVLLCASQASLTSWWVDGEINRAFQKEAQLMKERGKKVLALIPLNLDGFLFSADYQSGKKAEITSRVAANFVGWEKDHALFDRELEKVIRALRTGEGGREKRSPARL